MMRIVTDNVGACKVLNAPDSRIRLIHRPQLVEGEQGLRSLARPAAFEQKTCPCDAELWFSAFQPAQGCGRLSHFGKEVGCGDPGIGLVGCRLYAHKPANSFFGLHGLFGSADHRLEKSALSGGEACRLDQIAKFAQRPIPFATRADPSPRDASGNAILPLPRGGA